MYTFPIDVIVDSFRTDIKAANKTTQSGGFVCDQRSK